MPSVGCGADQRVDYNQFTLEFLESTGNSSAVLVAHPDGETLNITLDEPVAEGFVEFCGWVPQSGGVFTANYITPRFECFTNSTGLPALCHVLYNLTVACVPNNQTAQTPTLDWNNAAAATSAAGSVAAWLACAVAAVWLAAME